MAIFSADVGLLGASLRSAVLYTLGGLHLFYDVISPDTHRDTSLFVPIQFYT